MEWLQGIIGEDTSSGVQMAILFGVLVVVLLFLYWLFRLIFGSPTRRAGKGQPPRLSISDAAVVDDKRRLVLVRRDDVEHLVLIGGPSDIVVEQNIGKPTPIPTARVDQMTRREPVAPSLPAPETVPAKTEPRAEPQKTEASSAAPLVTGGAIAAGLSNTGSSLTGSLSESIKDTGTKISDAKTEVTSSTVDTVKQQAGAAVDATTNAAESVTNSASEKTAEIASDLGSALGLEEPKADTNAAPEVASAGNSPAPEVPEVKDTPTGGEKTEDEMQRLLDELSAEKA